MAEVRSGSFATTGYSDAYSPDHYVFSWSLASQSIVDNTTTINWSVVAAGGSTAGYYNTVRERYVTVYGATKSASDAQVTYNGTTPFSGTTVIKHDANGKGSFSASCGGAFEYGGSYNSTGSGSWELPTIARATTPVLAATTITMGSAVNLTLTPADASFKHKIRYEFGSLVSQIDGIKVGGTQITADYIPNGTITFTPPTSLGSQIPNNTSGTGKIICYTYTSSGTHIGTTYVNITLNVPSYTLTITGITLTGKNLLSAAYVQGKSSVTVNADVATQYGARIKSITTVIDGKSYTELPFTTGVLSSGSKTAKITFVDTRDKSVTVESAAIQVYAYSIPNITEFTLARQSDGTTVIATVKGSISAINNKNAKTIKVTLNGKTNTITSSAYTINATTTFTDVSTDQTFTAKAVFTDSYTSIEREANLPTIAVTMDFYKDGNGIAMGKVAEQGNLLDVAWDMNVDGNVTGRLYGLGESPSIPANSDLNNYLTPGIYNVGNNANAETLANIPLAQAGRLIVSNAAGYGTYLEQRYIPYRYGHSPANQASYIRCNNYNDATTWGAWFNEALKAYPVGSIYMSVNNTSPATLFGGTWEQIKNRFLIGCGDTYAAGATGGSTTVTLTANEMPVHEGHLYDNYKDNAYTDRNGDTNSYYLSSSASGYSKYENRPYKVVSGNEMVIQGYSRGGGAAHNNMPPYLAIYMWKRTA